MSGFKFISVLKKVKNNCFPFLPQALHFLIEKVVFTPFFFPVVLYCNFIFFENIVFKEKKAIS